MRRTADVDGGDSDGAGAAAAGAAPAPGSAARAAPAASSFGTEITGKRPTGTVSSGTTTSAEGGFTMARAVASSSVVYGSVSAISAVRPNQKRCLREASPLRPNPETELLDPAAAYAASQRLDM
jgi:hypothetical protein